MEEEVAGGGDGRVFGSLDFTEGVEFLGSRELVGECVPDGATDAYGAGEFGVRVAKGDILG